MTTEYHMGRAHMHEPEVADVLGCLLSDASGADETSFEDWASGYGYDSDSRKAERMYGECRKTAVRLRKFLGTKFNEFATAEH
jgi:hypothetical protein